MLRKTFLAAIAASLIAVPAVAQMPSGPPGKAEASRVVAGTYKVDANHTQVLWEVDHMGFTPLWGLFGGITGSLTLDPAKPDASKLSVEIPLSGITASPAGFVKHLSSPDFFDVAKFATATFVSTSVKASGNKATITGDLTIKGVTKPVTLDAQFYGAGGNPMSKAPTVGFTATTTIKRSDFGLGMAAPVVSDKTELKIVAAFEKQG